MEEINLFREKFTATSAMECSKTSICVHIFNRANASKDSKSSENRHRI
ncbi:MAG: hypothetical protein ACK59J_18260 [Pseudanabaena sp.]